MLLTTEWLNQLILGETDKLYFDFKIFFLLYNKKEFKYFILYFKYIYILMNKCKKEGNNSISTVDCSVLLDNVF